MRVGTGTEAWESNGCAGSRPGARRIAAGRRLREEFENGKAYAPQRHAIHLPDRAGDHPDPALLRWHNEQVFERGAA